MVNPKQFTLLEYNFVLTLVNCTDLSLFCLTYIYILNKNFFSQILKLMKFDFIDFKLLPL